MQLGRDAGLPFNQYGSSGDSFTIGSPNELNVIAHYTETEPYLRFVSSNPSQQPLIDSLVIEAASRVKQVNFGSTVWHSATCPAPHYQIDAPFSMGPFIERLSNQTRIVGWRRLGSSVLIEFAEELPNDWDPKNALFAPKALAQVHIAVAAPCAGNFSTHIALGADLRVSVRQPSCWAATKLPRLRFGL